MAEEAEPVLVSDPVPVVGRRWRFVCRLFKMGFRPCLLSCLTYFLWFLSPPPLDWIQDSGTLLSSLAFALETRSAAPAEPFLQNSIWVDDYYQGDIYR